MDDPGVVIVDLGPYQPAGSDAVRRLQKGARAPIIVLSGQVSGTGRGAKARCLGQAQPVRIGDTMIDLTAKRITRRRPGAGEEVRLTPTEWHLLEVLLRSPGRLLSRQQILAAVWGPGYDRAAGNLRLYMTQLRRKLEPDPARPRWLVTEPGAGLPLPAQPARQQRPARARPPLPGAAPRITRLA
jgi:two-component system, OmpR family, KDP operon response regulator KdpE